MIRTMVISLIFGVLCGALGIGSLFLFQVTNIYTADSIAMLSVIFGFVFGAVFAELWGETR